MKIIFAGVIIVVNTRLLIAGRLDGIGRFTTEIFSRVTRMHPETEFVFLFDGPIAEEFIFSENITPVKLLPPARRPVLYSIWLNWSVAGVLRDLKADLFVSPDGFLPLKGKTKSLAVIHDLNFEHYPQDLPKNYSKWYRKNFPLFAQRATRLATVSEYSKQDIASRYKVNPDKIDIVHNAAAKGFVPATDEVVKQTRKKYSGGQPYFLYIGALHARKNIERLIRAFGQFKRDNNSPEKLLICGGSYWKGQSIQDALATVPAKEDVVFTGRVEEAELYRIAGSALAMTYVPYFEGFGIPLVEAMSCDVPIITSAVTSMPEVAGEAALYCDPFSTDSIAAAMQKIAADPALRAELIGKGRKQRQLFSWEKSANDLWTGIEKTLA